MLIKIINKSSNPLPKYSTEFSAGMDLCANLTEELTIKPLQRVLVPTGLYMELPEGYEAQIRPRSGLAIKSGITVLNTPGTIDCDYRGEIKVILVNLSDQDFVVHHGDRICQMVIAKYEQAQFQVVEQLSDSVRSDGGFGHTGI
jgi:dUTP pyrophosphatase